ncbi:MAG TPA: alpha/beta hydrolase [Wenzhouxiangella sp.]|nr:alpha/beta hydrolase [Wenzhouxiangella sp.]
MFLLLLSLTAVISAWILFWYLWPRPLGQLMLALERTRAGMRPRTVTSNGIDWHLLAGGHGEPLVLLHGFNADSDHFSRIGRHLNTHFRVIAPDLPGFGLTRYREPLDFSMEAQARRVLELLDVMDIERFYLGGSSMGGLVACTMARIAPQRMRALWLLNPGGLHQAPLSPLLQTISDGGKNALVVRNRRDFVQLMDHCFVSPPWVPGPVWRLAADRAARRQNLAEIIFAAMRFESAPLEALAPGIDIPALIVWGRDDRVLHSDSLAILGNLMPQSKTLMMPDTGHLPMLEKPRESAEAWISYAESLAQHFVHDSGRV